MQDKWSSIVQDTIRFYRQALQDQLHSVYVRGSVAKGNAVEFISDLDSFALSKTSVDACVVVDCFRRDMKERYPYCLGVETIVVPLTTLSDAPPKRTRSIWEEIIKTQARCVFGENMAPAIASFRLKEMVGHSLYIQNEVEHKLPRYLEEDKDDPEELKGLCMWIMRRLLRSAFDLVMLREGRFTRDLSLSQRA